MGLVFSCRSQTRWRVSTRDGIVGRGWRETMWSLKDAEEEVWNIMLDREILCVVCLSLFSCLIYIYILGFFSDSHG